MPIKLPNLDDRTFADLVEEAHALIPVHAPEWTNHNEADPGITFIEMFAYLTEMLIYRLNRVTAANVCAFLKLIDGIERIPSTRNLGRVCRVEGDENALSDKVRDVVSNQRSQGRAVSCEDFQRLVLAADEQLRVKEFALSDEVRHVVSQLRSQDRAVTCADFERLAKAADPQVKRAHCVHRRNLDSDTPDKRADAHMSVVIYPRDDALREKVRRYLEPRRLLTTRVHVVPSQFVTIGVHLSITLKPDAVGETVRAEVENRLKEFFDPAGDEHGREGWPFGRDVYVSEIYRLLDRVSGVDFITALKDKDGKPIDILTAHDAKGVRRIPQEGRLVGISLNADELVRLSLERSELVLVTPTEKELEG